MLASGMPARKVTAYTPGGKVVVLACHKVWAYLLFLWPLAETPLYPTVETPSVGPPAYPHPSLLEPQASLTCIHSTRKLFQARGL